MGVIRQQIGSWRTARSSRSGASASAQARRDRDVGGRAGRADAGVHLRRRRPALREGQTFYTPNRGIPELREALMRLHGASTAWRCRTTASR